MKRASTATFVLTIPLVVKPGEDRILIGRMEAGRRLLRDATDGALRALCAETASLQVRTHQSEWDMVNTGFRVWRQKYGGALHISTRRESAKATATRAQALYARLVAASGPHRRQRNGR